MIINEDCSYSGRCANAHRCYVCHDLSLLKLPEDKAKQKARTTSFKHRDTKDSWRQLEASTAQELSSVPTAREAYRQSGSGNKWYKPGDVVDDILLLEAKERDTLTARGEQSISIQRLWLEKITEEARGSGRYPGVVFRYKGDETTYAIMELTDLSALVHEIKLLREQNEHLEGELERRKDHGSNQG